MQKFFVDEKRIQAKSNRLTSERGFSLVEVIVSVFLVTVGLMAAVQLLSKGLIESVGSRDQLIATSLAQEGAELVRNVRDNNWATGAASFAHINEGNSAFCRIDKDYTYPNLINCGSHLRLNIDSNGFYIHTGASAKFYRKLLITNDADGNKNIVSIVTWSGSSILGMTKAACTLQRKCVYVETTLSNWNEAI